MKTSVLHASLYTYEMIHVLLVNKIFKVKKYSKGLNLAKEVKKVIRSFTLSEYYDMQITILDALK